MLTPNDVFTPGQIPIRPTNVYAARGDAEALFRKSLARGMIPVIYGEYGVGKTSMARHVVRDAEAQDRLVNIESVADKSLQDVFSRCLEKLGYSVTIKRIEGAGSSISNELFISKEKYNIIDEVEIYVKEFAKQNNIKVVGSYDPYKLNLKNEH